MTRAPLAASALLVGAVLAAQEPVQVHDVDLTVTEGTGLTVAMSPNHRWLAINLLGGVWILPAAGGTAQRITPESIETGNPVWAPDSESLAFEGYEDGPWHIYTMRRDGTRLAAATSGAYDDREPDWSHDGRRIVFSSDRFGGIRTIWTVQIADGMLTRITGEDSEQPSWAPADALIAFASNRPSRTPGRRELTLRSIDALGRERVLGDTSEIGIPSFPSLSSNGRRLAFELNGQLVIDGRVASSADEVLEGQRVQWLSDLDVLYSASGHITRRSFDGRETIVPFSAKVTLKRPTYHATHRALEPVDPQPMRGIVSPVVSPNGRSVAFAAVGDLWVATMDGVTTRLTNDAAVERDPAWSPDSSQLAYSSDRGEGIDLWIRNLANGMDTLVAHEHGDVTAAAWSPDGTRIAFLVDDRNPKVVRVSGPARGGDGDVSMLSFATLGRPTWSPDGRTLAMGTVAPVGLGGGFNQIAVHELDPPVDRFVTIFADRSAANRQSSGPVWSPDGQRLAFSANGQLWTVDTDVRGMQTSRPQAIAFDHPDSPSWESDSKHLVFQTPSGLRRIAADGGAPENLPIAYTWAPSVPPERTIIHAGHVFTGLTDNLSDVTDIVVEHGIVTSIESHDDTRHVGLVVDASDETVMPGLIDMNAPATVATTTGGAQHMLEAGITSVRIAAVHPYAGLEQRESLDNGRRIGPRIFMAGDPIDGRRVRDAGGVSAFSPTDVDEALERATLLGADFIATRTRLARSLHPRVTAYAHEHGLPASTSELTAALFFGYDVLAQLPRRIYRDVVDAAGLSGLTVLSTIGVPAEARQRQTLDRVAAERVSMLKAIAKAGGRVVVAPVVPTEGSTKLSIHDEVENMARGGFSPLEAWRAATVDAAAALGVDDVLGTIEPGKLADFAFVIGDPLQDPRAARSVHRVMRGGRLYEVMR